MQPHATWPVRVRDVARRELLGLRIHPFRRGELLTRLWDLAEHESRPRRMYYTNAHVFNLACEDDALRASLNAADILIIEGYGGKLGGRLAGVDFPEQLATMDWMDEFLDGLVARGRGRVHLIGDEPGVASACAIEMERRHPGLTITGTEHGYFDKVGTENSRVVAGVQEAYPDVLMVGMGTPLQEQWIDEHIADMHAPLVLALGAMFRWYSGVEARAPRWMRVLHLEWLLRLIKHPVRHASRYLFGNAKFVIRCLAVRFTSR